jgi:ABC-type Na+ efflux pump permease subunit
MNRILLVARRDYRQVVATRAFKLTLLIVPLMIGLMALATSLLRPPTTVAYMMADTGTGMAAGIEHRLELDYQRQVMRDLAAYARRWNAATPGEDWADDTAVEAFLRAGGIQAALQRLHLPPGTPAFKPPSRPYLRVPLPADIPVTRGAGAFGRAVASYLGGQVETAAGRRALAVAIYLPARGTVGVWTSGRPSNGLIGAIQDERTRLLRQALLRASGVDAATAARIETAQAPLAVAPPPPERDRAQMAVRSAVPLALVYLLLTSALITGGMMLQGVIEERSNRLLEAVLACVEPRELLLGKLIGLGGVGLTVLAAWVGCALLAAFSMDGFVADTLRPSLAALSQPWMIPLMLFYFFCGYLVLAMAYLTIGSLSNSMQDAQAYLMPVSMAVLLPVMLMVTASLQNPDSLMPRVMSWIPPYTPFAMLARLGTGVGAAEVVATGLLLIVFVALEMRLLGRVFTASLLGTGQPPRLGTFLKLMRRPQ